MFGVGVMRVASLVAIAALAAAYNSPFTPMQVHLSYAGAHGMRVSWNTYQKVIQPTVFYGENPYALLQHATSSVSVTYQQSTTYNNHVKLSNLKPDTTYYYRPEFSTKTYSFKTSRLPGDMTPYEVALVVDMGTFGPLGLSTHVGTGAANPLTPGEITTLQSLQSQLPKFDFLWHPGDIAYADYWLKEEIQGYLPNTTIADGYKVYERILNAFYDEMVPITSKKPYMVGPGNHEANCDNGGTKDKVHNISYTVDICMPGQTNFTGYINHFRMPSRESGGTGNFWYSFDHGMVHYIQLDTETDLGHGLIGPDEPGGPEDEDSGPFNATMNAQSDWLQRDLAAVDRRKTPWVIVAGHRPWYVSAANDSGTICENCRQVFEPLFHQYGVDLVLSGHVHAYERNAPVYNFNQDPAGLDNPRFPWYITNGAAGHYDGLDSLEPVKQPYSRFAQDTVYGWSTLQFHNCTHMTHNFIASANGTVLDSATLFKNRTCAGSQPPKYSPPGYGPF